MAAQRTAHALDLISSLENLRANNIICDFKIKTGGLILHVHRAVLAACSDYFRAMFTSNMNEVQEGIVEMKDVEADAVKQCISFMYTGQANVTMENVRDTLHASTLMQLNKLTGYCFDFMGQNLSVQNCSSVKAVADFYSCKEIRKMADEYAVRNFEALVSTDNFHLLGKADLCRYLRLAKKSESVLWEAVSKWINHNPEKRGNYLSELAKSARIENYSFPFLLETVWKNPLVQQSQACQDLIANILFSNLTTLKKNINMKNCFILNRMTENKNALEVKREILVFMEKNFEEVSKTKQFNKLSEKDILSLFKNPESFLFSEKIKWHSAIKWTKHHSSRKQTFPKLLKLINFQRFTRDFFRENVLTEDLVKMSHECKDFLLEVISTQNFKSLPPLVVLDKENCRIDAYDVPSKQWHYHTQVEGGVVMRILSLKGDLYLYRDRVLYSLSKNGVWTERAKIENMDAYMNEEIILVAFRNGIYAFSYGGYVSYFDPKKNSWDVWRYQIAHHGGHCVAASENLIYALGGMDEKKASTFNPVTGECKEICRMTHGRCLASAAVLNDLVFVLGGWTDGENSAEFYNPATDKWTEVANMQRHRNMFSSLVIDGKLYAVGGNFDPNHREERAKEDSIEVYNTELNRWEIVAKMRKVRGPVCACLIYDS